MRATVDQIKKAFQQFHNNFTNKKNSYHVAKSNGGAAITQDKSMLLDMLEGTDMLDCRPTDILMDPSVEFLPGYTEPLTYTTRYRYLISKLNYFTQH